ncbi:hypothetical protein OF83DRAFT_1057774 [Amylostereum chailletii]|nr:hypothetical protein OF83DRAFT_1057774 [Amylostereum chailletii]
MSSATARAEARRKAILSRGSDRLSRLTSSARGDDAPAFAADDPPIPPLPTGPRTNLENFIGEESSLPTPPSRQTRPTSNFNSSPFDMLGRDGGTPPDPSVWSPEQQQQFIRALMGGAAAPSPSAGALPAATPPNDPTSSPPEDPFAALMSLAQAQGGAPSGFDFGKGASMPMASPKPKTRLQKLLPLLHIISVWCLVAYFALWHEPRAFLANTSSSIQSESPWRRWGALATGPPEVKWGVQVMPFIWAFVTLELGLHSIRIFTGLDTTQPPMLLALALPHLPPPIRSIIIHGLKYLKMGGTLLDDLAAAIVAFGFLVALSSWLSVGV